MCARTAPTGTVSSSATSIESRTPETGEGTSVSTLSVEISSSGSSAATASPTDFSQRVTVPSVTLSPSAGRVTSAASARPRRGRPGRPAAADRALGRRGDGLGRSGSTAGTSASRCGRGGAAAQGPRRVGRVRDDGQLATDQDDGVLRGDDAGEDAGRGARDLGVDLVGGDLEQRLVGLHGVAFRLEPPGDRAFGDALAQLGHRDGDRHVVDSSGRGRMGRAGLGGGGWPQPCACRGLPASTR